MRVGIAEDKLKNELDEIHKDLKKLAGNINSIKKVKTHTKVQLNRCNKQKLISIVMGQQQGLCYQQSRIIEINYDKKRLLEKIRKLLIERYMLKQSKDVNRNFKNVSYKEVLGMLK